MDVWTAIRTKRMVRRFEPRPLAQEHLTQVVDAGRHAGSSKNEQRWDFVVVEDRDRLRGLSEVGPYAGHLAGAAAAVALLTPDPRAPGASLSLVWDAGLAAENMMLAAWELGIGSCPATVYDQSIARRVLGFPEDRCCGCDPVVRLSGGPRGHDPAAEGRVAGSPSTRSCTASAGSPRGSAQGTSAATSSTGSASGGTSGAGAPSAR